MSFEYSFLYLTTSLSLITQNRRMIKKDLLKKKTPMLTSIDQQRINTIITQHVVIFAQISSYFSARMNIQIKTTCFGEKILHL